jgi:hypothetical protein
MNKKHATQALLLEHEPSVDLLEDVLLAADGHDAVLCTSEARSNEWSKIKRMKTNMTMEEALISDRNGVSSALVTAQTLSMTLPFRMSICATSHADNDNDAYTYTPSRAGRISRLGPHRLTPVS